MKGLLKGLRYISQIFEEEKEQEMQIGLPTDVKHVAHVGCDGPSTNDPPSWMKEFKSGSGFRSAPLGPPEDLGEDSEIKLVFQDSRKGKRETYSESRDLPHDLPKSSRHHSSTENTNDSPRKKESSTKPRQSRRSQQSKDPFDNKSSSSSSSSSKSSNRHPKESTDSAQNNLRDNQKKSRRKKSKESVTDSGGSSLPRSKAATNCIGGVCTNPYMDPGHDTGSTLRNLSSRPSPIQVFK